MPDAYKSSNNIRVVTATALFDGHDASINIMRRILQDTGVEVIHLGHNRSVMEIVDAAVQEDVQGIAVSSYQGGHVEFFKYMVDLLKERNSGHIKIFAGGGGVIVPDEIKELEEYGVTKIYSPEDGSEMGLQGMVNHMLACIEFSTVEDKNFDLAHFSSDNKSEIAKLITFFEQGSRGGNLHMSGTRALLEQMNHGQNIPVLGIAGTGGAGKSSLADELILRFLQDVEDISIAVVSTDPSRRKTGGALLGDRIRMNSIGSSRVYMRSLATRTSQKEISGALADAIMILKAAGFDLIIAETAGTGQGDSNIFDISDLSLYVMTSDFGSPSQLEKIDMLDYADIVVVNKFEKQGSEDALRDVARQVRRNRNAFDQEHTDMPVFGTIASRFNDDGMTALYFEVLETILKKTGVRFVTRIRRPDSKSSSSKTVIIPPERVRYLAEVADTVGDYHRKTHEQAEVVRKIWHLEETIKTLEGEHEELGAQLRLEIAKAELLLEDETKILVDGWDKTRSDYGGDCLVCSVSKNETSIPLYSESLSHLMIPKVVLPSFSDPGEVYRWQREENLPGRFPFTAGVFPLKRMDEDPTRMFAGEGNPERTNQRFKLLSGDYEAARLSTAFDSVTLYGCDPDQRMDIYGKVGNSGVSVCTVDDVKKLYDGFDLSAPNTSVSMTINGPAPIILAMFFNAAIDQQVERFKLEHEREPSAEEAEIIKNETLSKIRGTVQADILKEDQGQNTCIFSIDFALKMMGDIQKYLIAKNIRNFYSVSISGYHIAEAGANPVTQLAFTLANGFTYLEYYLSQGMDIDSFAPSFSFFFSSGMDPEYTVIGRVARRIWAIALRERYGASERSQILKYHIQTSGRSLHSKDIQFNDIRTTLQALCGIYDNCNSLHTNAYDEAVTTPTEASVRRALAIQMIINREWGLTKNENMNQGSFIVEELTRLVEEAVLGEFHRITSRGGVLGAMETGYQRSKIQEESLYYEKLKHSGELPLTGVNTFINPNDDLDDHIGTLELARSTDAEKQSQLSRLKQFQVRNKEKAPGALKKLQETALSGGNIFEELMETVKFCSLGQIVNALYETGGRYRRNM